MKHADDLGTMKHIDKKSLISVSREVVQTADDAREISVKRIDADRLDAEKNAAANRVADADAKSQQAMLARMRAESATADADRRRAEAEEAARRAGFAPVFLDPPLNIDLDGDLARATRRIATELPGLVREHDASIVVSPSPHDVHHGHEAVGRGVQRALAVLPPTVRWWMWGVWGELPAPNVFFAFNGRVLERAAHILDAYTGELERNDYQRLLSGRATANAVLGSERNDRQSRRLQAMIPLDRARMLDLGCGAGAWSAQIASEHPWIQVTGVDVGEDFIAVARERHASDRVDFVVADFLSLPFADGTFDCVYADNALEHAFDVDATLAEARRVLAEDGALVAAIPPDAYDTRRTTDNHTWKASAKDACERLRHAGFVDVSVEETDTYRLGAAPYPPAADRMLYVRAWRRTAPLAPIDRIDALRRWTHARLDPSRASESFNPAEVLQGGYAYCAGMTLVLGEALVREGFKPRWVTMVAHDHPRGRGPHLSDTHEIIELTLADHSVHVVDPMADVRFPYALHALIDDPNLADGVERDRDPVYLARGYALYSTSFWYRRVVAIAVRSWLRGPQHFVPARWADRSTEPPYQALAFVRARAWRAIRRLRRL